MAELRLKPQTTSDLASKAQNAAGDITFREAVIQDTSIKSFDDIQKSAAELKKRLEQQQERLKELAAQRRDLVEKNRLGGSFDEDVASKYAGKRIIPGEDDKNKRENLSPYSADVSDESFLSKRMQFFDNRIYRQLDCIDVVGNHFVNFFYPHFDYGSFVTDWYESPTSVENAQYEYQDVENVNESEKKSFEDRAKFLRKFNREKYNEYLASRAFVHPYAILKLAGACGNRSTVEKYLTYDRYNIRRFYEIDGSDSFSANYSKTPTTTSLIRWGNESERGKTPYTFQDFVFCKWWNKIENNRLITLRRYAAPVTDNINFRDYDVISQSASDDKVNAVIQATDGKQVGQTFVGKYSNSPWTPLATAVTYFGEETGNNLSDILAFSAGYNWEDVEAEKDPIQVSSAQNDAASGLNVVSGVSAIMSGLDRITKVLGIFGEMAGQNRINLDAVTLPPDPYKNGPYENRILGPVNVIMNTVKRKRGLTFKGDGLKITFDYVARPIAGINSKAVLLDLLSNMLVMTYASGTWFGGMWRYNADKPALYPFKYGDAMNKLHKGQIFGKDGAVRSLVNDMKQDAGSIATFLPDALKTIGNLFKGALNSLSKMASSFLGGGEDGDKKNEGKGFKDAWEDALSGNIGKGIQKAIAAKVLQGTTIPYLSNQKALLTGDPVGNWHLTIGNPLNPIAMIGNLICKDVSVKFSNELGPDDFPIGFTAEVTLQHGLGRDRDAIESMFNRGFGRIYALSELHKSTADGETKIDDYTGGQTTQEGRTVADEIHPKYYGGGTRFIMKTQQSELANRGSVYSGDTGKFKFLTAEKAELNKFVPSLIQVTPWQMGFTLG